ncbi:MAG: peptide deformylase [Clostridia bacterium]|nr:peptide deformylase [Clostridia bacterium]
MAIRKILFDGEPILRKISKPVVVFDKSLVELFDDMQDTLDKQQGAGLSAVQVGILKRMFIILDGDKPIRVVNPEIISSSGVCKTTAEGCLSVPGKWGDVERPNKVVVKYQDQNGNFVDNTFTGFTAKTFCHEFDHLNGILFIDKATNLFDTYEEYHRFKQKQEKNKK